MNINYNFRSPNYSIRKGLINFIIIHFTEISFDESLKRLCGPGLEVSAHYLIKSNGEIFNLVDDQYCAWHAGVSFWKGFEKLNDYSIGIELDNDGKSNFSKSQMEACVTLCQHLKKLYNIETQNIIGHSDIAPSRKIDPGIFFDWANFAKSSLGAWHSVVLPKDSDIILEFGSNNAKVFELQNNLQKLGYKIDKTGIFDLQTNYVIRAFQAHFYPTILQKLGIDFYWDETSKYFWDEASDLLMSDLIQKLKN